MLLKEKIIKNSIKSNLLFQRLIKEHMYLIETNLQPVEKDNILKAKKLKQNFENLLSETVYYANGILSQAELDSNQFVTPLLADHVLREANHYLYLLNNLKIKRLCSFYLYIFKYNFFTRTTCNHRVSCRTKIIPF